MNEVSARPPPPVSRAHHPCSLCAAAALALVGLLLAGVQGYVQWRLPERMAAFGEHPSPIKLTGNLLQTEAFTLPAMLPIYGSSELDRPADNRPDAFFRDRPTGFSTFLIGRGGTTCLLILQKVAAVGRAARGKKAVVFLSPSWFIRDEVGENAVDANLTAPQLSAWTFGGVLSRPLRQRVARRLLEYPDSMADQPLLWEAVHCMAEPTRVNRALFALLTPLGSLQNALFQRLEACAVLREMAVQPARPAVHETPGAARPDWTRLAAEAENKDRARHDGAVYSATNLLVPADHRAERFRKQPVGSRDHDFAAEIAHGREFGDLRLLADALKELQVDALFISQPFNGIYKDLGGTSQRGREVYYRKLARTMMKTSLPLRDFNDHEEDRFFFNDANHPSAKAWVYYDHALDDFYHRTR